MGKNEDKYVEIKEGWFASKYALDGFKRGLSPEVVILREEPVLGEYDQWRIIYHQPESVVEEKT